jgi:UDP-glucose:(glucosyl)LPS alpha-1,2-glucosyltransferase
MSVIYKGKILDTNLSRNANGGTEQMRKRLIENIDQSLLENVAIHLSRVRTFYEDVPNILWCHDLPSDPENNHLHNNGWQKFSLFVFVTCWQRDMFVEKFKIPYSKCTVIENAIEPAQNIQKDSNKIRLIYHTTPHRGLELLYHSYNVISKEFKDEVHLDIFSSFEIYGWKERDKPYEDLFQKLSDHKYITYHGSQPNSVIREYLSKAHYYPYPCIWQETSCISLIEAIEHKVIAIHPNYGALPETAGQNTYMYNYSDDVNEHLNRFHVMLYSIIKSNLHNYNFKNINTNIRHDISTFTNKWTNLLKEFK